MPQMIAGLDLSLSGTAGIVLDDTGVPFCGLAYTSQKRFAAAHGGAASLCGGKVEIIYGTPVRRGDVVNDFRRTSCVAHSVIGWLKRNISTGSLIGIEDHAFGAKGASIYQLGHLHGVVRDRIIWELASKFVLLGIKQIKAAATGNGNASKDDMVAALGQALDVSALPRDAQEGLADAYAVARLTHWFHMLKSGKASISRAPVDIAALVVSSKTSLLDRVVVAG